MGEVKPHRNKVSKFFRLVKKAASVASAGAFVGGVTGGLVGGSINAISTVGKCFEYGRDCFNSK